MNHQQQTPGAFRWFVSVAAALCVCAATATAKPTVYNGLPPDQEGGVRRSIQGALGDRFTIAPVPDKEQFLPARVTKRSVHPYIREVGRVTIAAVADVDGRLRDPVVIESTNSRLNIMMRDSVKKWGCTPARLNGTPVASVTQSTIEVRWRKPIRIY